LNSLGFRVARIADDVINCGLCAEPALILPALLWLRARRRRKRL
jgi:hypothetical protein